MKFTKNFLYDLRHGIWENKFLCFCPIFIAMLAFFDFILQTNMLIEGQAITQNSISFGDIWIYLFGGLIEPTKKNLLPIIWTVLVSVLPFLLLNYPDQDIHNFGRLTLVSAGSRTYWWISKFIWNILGTVLYYILIATTVLIASFIFKIPLSNTIHTDLLRYLFVLDFADVDLTATQIPVIVMIMPFLISVVLNLLEMVFTLFMKPMFGFLTTFILLVSSIYIRSPFWYTSYSMLLRYNWLCRQGLSYRNGILFGILLIGAVFIVGLIKFRWYDILNQD